MSVKTAPKIRDFSNSVEAAQAIQDYFKEVVTNYDFHDIPVVHPGPREAFATDKMHISEIAGSCPRLPVLSALVPREEDETREPNGFFISGHLHESFVVGCLNLGHPGEFDTQLELDNIPAEVQSHTDVWWPDRNTVIEIKSIGLAARGTAHYPRESALRQAASYAYFIGHKTGVQQKAVVVYIFRDDPSQIDVFPVPEHLMLEMAMRVEEAVQNYRNREVPPVPSDFKPGRFPCQYKNREGRVFSCRLYDVCWANYTEPEPVEIDDEMGQKLADALAYTKKRLAAVNQEKDALGKRARELEGMLTPWFNKGPRLLTNDSDYDVKRITVDGKMDYDWNKALRTGLITPEVLAQIEVRKPGYSYTMLVKKKTGEEAE